VTLSCCYCCYYCSCECSSVENGCCKQCLLFEVVLSEFCHIVVSLVTIVRLLLLLTRPGPPPAPVANGARWLQSAGLECPAATTAWRQGLKFTSGSLASNFLTRLLRRFVCSFNKTKNFIFSFRLYLYILCIEPGKKLCHSKL
jgi:hypothetical protein